jgi:hypothetical protein
MSGNTFSVDLHSTFLQKVSNFPEGLYNFNNGDSITTLMTILLGNSGTGQLRNLQTVARIGQQYLEFSNLDNILGTILGVDRVTTEIYSFASNPFIDQLSNAQWQEVITKDSNYRERLLGAAEAYQTGPNLWGVLTMAEALTQNKFYLVESWRTPGYGRTGLNPAQEFVLIPLTDTATASGGVFNWDQSKVRAITSVIQNLTYANFQISFAKNPVQTFTQVTGTYVAASGYSEFFYLSNSVNSASINTPTTIDPGAITRYWIKNNSSNNVAPHFAHLQTQELSIDLTGNVSYVSVSDNSSFALNSVAVPSLQVTSTVYGAQ